MRNKPETPAETPADETVTGTTTTDTTGPEADPAASSAGAFAGCEPLTAEQQAEREGMYNRLRALELAAAPGIHEAKEPILSVLARAEAYRAYIETGATGA